MQYNLLNALKKDSKCELVPRLKFIMTTFSEIYICKKFYIWHTGNIYFGILLPKRKIYFLVYETWYMVSVQLYPTGVYSPTLFPIITELHYTYPTPQFYGETQSAGHIPLWCPPQH
jgi:hypothetical protein